MSNQPIAKTEQILGLLGGTLGLIVGLVMGALRMGLINLQPGEVPAQPSDGTLLGNLAFLFAYTLPFALALLALGSNNPSIRAAVWLGATILGLFASFTAFSGFTLLLFPLPTILLGLAAVLAFRAAGIGQAGRILAVTTGLVVLGSGAWLALFAQENPQCWALIRTADGADVWEARPFSHTSPLLPANPGPGGVVQWSCASDVIAPAEAVLSLGLWALALTGFALYMKLNGSFERTG